MSDIKVTVEPPSENQIVEVTYDGQEIVQPPFTQAEHLMRQATKLDFSTIPDDLDEDIDDDNDEDTEENNSESKTLFNVIVCLEFKISPPKNAH